MEVNILNVSLKCYVKMTKMMTMMIKDRQTG